MRMQRNYRKLDSFSDYEMADIRTSLANGETHRSLCERYNLSGLSAMVARIRGMEYAGFDFDAVERHEPPTCEVPRRRVPSRLTHEEFADIRQRRANGDSQQRIADDLNMSRGGVIRALGLIGEMEANGEFVSSSAADQTLDTASAVLASCSELVEALQSLVAEIHSVAGE